MIKPKLINVLLSNITGYHPSAKNIAALLSEQLFLGRMDVLSDSSIQHLLFLHPILLTKVDDAFLVIGGFRSYQLAIVQMTEHQNLPCLIYSTIPDKTVIELAQTDVLGSALIHSLGTKTVAQLEHIKKGIGTEGSSYVTPGLTSCRKTQSFEQITK